MSIKTYLHALLGAHHDSHKSLPSAASIYSTMQLERNESGGVSQTIYTAPCDGFITVKAHSANFFVLRDENLQDYTSSDVTNGGSLAVVSMPIRKGAKAMCYTPTDTKIDIVFRKAVGS